MFNLQASAGICKDTCRELPGMFGQVYRREEGDGRRRREGVRMRGRSGLHLGGGRGGAPPRNTTAPPRIE